MKKIFYSINLNYLFLLLALFIAGCDNETVNSDYASNSEGASGTGGSMARFTIKDDMLFTVDQNRLKLFDISQPDKPLYMKSRDQQMDWGVETVFVMDTLLFIGSQSAMYIYDVTTPFPKHVTTVSHIRSCDPVVAQGNYAFVTLNTRNSWCGRSSNVLQVYDISDLKNVALVKEIPMISPLGLGVDGNKLFVCDNLGIKLYDISDPTDPEQIGDLDHIRELSEIDTYDVIPLDGVLMVVGDDGFYQFDYRGEELHFLSAIAVKRDK